MILAVQHLEKSFGDHLIVNDGSFHIEEKEKAALIGINGAGKTTILRMIIGEESLDGGDVILRKGLSMGYLAQQSKTTPGNTIFEEVSIAKGEVIALEQEIRNIEKELKTLSPIQQEERLKTYHRLVAKFEYQNGYAYKSEIIGVLKGLGFTEDDFGKDTDTLSGGEKTRVALGRLLLTKPDVLLLDEPTNHLDLNSVAWLENYLLNYQGAVLIVSHDRYFLNKVVTKIIEIENGKLYMFSGNYKDYAMKKQMLRDMEIKAYLNQQSEIKRQEKVIEKLKQFNREKSIKRAESREKHLAKIEVLDKPEEVKSEMFFSLDPGIVSGNDVLSVDSISKSFGSLNLFTNASFEIKRGEHIALLGDNGTGKTTLLKILNGIIPPDSGSLTFGTNVQLGYYDQEHDILHDEKEIFNEISDAYPNLGNTKIRNTLAAFQFTGDDVFKQIGDLSGGEKGRVALAKLMLSEANFLILDEPTNHLDITSKEILEHALNEYTGTILYVSHDRYFINQTASRIIDLTNKVFVNYIGDYDYYLEKKEHLTTLYASENQENTDQEQIAQRKLDWQEDKERKAKERKRLNDLKKTEHRIHELEEQNKGIEEMLTLEEVFSNPDKCHELTIIKDENDKELTHLYERWEMLENIE